MKKAIVTGGMGFIGRNLVRELHNNNVFVIVVDKYIGAAKDDSQTRYIRCELSDINKLPELIPDRNIDIVFHLAWQGVADADTGNYAVQMANVKAVLDLLDAAKQMQISNFLGAGSLHEIEGRVEMETEKPIRNPRFAYKAAKYAAHGLAKAKAGENGIRFLWPLITNTYGYGDRSNRLINYFIRSVQSGQSPSLSSGEQIYDFVYISDLAHALYLIGEKGVDGRDYMIGSGALRPLREWLEEAGRAIDPKIPLGFGEIKSNVISVPASAFRYDSLFEDTGFAPEVSFAEGVRLAAQWLKQLDSAAKEE